MDCRIKRIFRNVRYFLSVIICFVLCFNSAAFHVQASELSQDMSQENDIATDTDAEIGTEPDDGGILFEAEHEEELYEATQEYGIINIAGTRRYDYAYQMLDLINEKRAANGLTPLSMDVDLLEAAMKRTLEVCISYSSTRPDGSSYLTISSKVQAENMGGYREDLTAIVDDCMNDFSKRENILNEDTKAVGIGCVYQNGRLWWVQCFGKAGIPADTVTQPQNRNVIEQVKGSDNIIRCIGMDPQDISNVGDNQIYIPTAFGQSPQDRFNVGATIKLYMSSWNIDLGVGADYLVDGSSFNWQSSNPKVASVDSSGKVTIKSKGVAIITAVLKTTPYTKWRFVVNSEGKSETVGGYEEIQAFVSRLYDKCLNRTADDEGMETWTNILVSKTGTGASVAKGFVYSKEYIGKNVSDEEYLNMLYRVFLDREADAEGRSTWLNLMEQGLSRDYVFRGFVESTEYTNICESYGIERGTVTLTQPRDKNPNMTKFVNRLYVYVLGRNGETDGLNDWCKALQNKLYTPVQVGDYFVLSDEFKAKNLSDEEYIKVLYRAYLGREYDEEGLATWLNLLRSGTSRETVLRGFTNSAEFRNIINNFGL